MYAVSLPRHFALSFLGGCKYIRSPNEAEKLCRQLLRDPAAIEKTSQRVVQRVLGVDCEWNATWRSGGGRKKTALLQLAWADQTGAAAKTSWDLKKAKKHPVLQKKIQVRTR